MEPTFKDISLHDFHRMIGEAYELDAEIDRVEKETLAPLKKKRDELETVILGHLAKADLSSYKTAHGTVVRARRYSVRVPSDYNAKQAFFQWLMGEGEDIYWRMTTVNSQSLNALYKERLELARESGDLNFAIPGIGEPTLTETLALRKAK